MDHTPDPQEKGSGEERTDNYFDHTEAYVAAPPPPAPPEVGNGYAIASLILGLVGFFCCSGCFPPISILAIVFAVIDRKRRGSFRGNAIAGLILGIIGLVSCFASAGLFLFAYMMEYGLSTQTAAILLA